MSPEDHLPRISEFYGIVIAMFYNDHNPPHFHAIYAGQRAAVGIERVTIIDGDLPPRAWNLVREWTAARRQELLEDWELARKHEPLKPITPLE